MRPPLFYIIAIAFFISCLNKNSSITNIESKDTSLIIKSTSLSNGIKYLALVIKKDTIDYPFGFTNEFIASKFLPNSSMTINEYLTLLKDILPYYVKEINTSNKFNIILNNQLGNSYEYKFDRRKLDFFFNQNNIDNTYKNGVLNKSLEYSNFKTDVEKILPRGYYVKRFSSEKVDFNITDLKRNSKLSNTDSIEFSRLPYIGFLSISVEKLY